MRGSSYNELDDVQGALMNAEEGIDQAIAEITTKCKYLRNCLDASPKRNLTTGDFWGLSERYKFDILVRELEKIARQIVTSLTFSARYSTKLADISMGTYDGTMVDHMFWYHIDFGVRLLSSGWDRIALLLDLAYDLELHDRCNLSRVMKELPKVAIDIEKNENFKFIKRYRDNEFTELENGPGKGARHETTHILTPSSRHFFSFLESHNDDTNVLEPHKWMTLLKKQFHLYLQGIKKAASLMEKHGLN